MFTVDRTGEKAFRIRATAPGGDFEEEVATLLEVELAIEHYFQQGHDRLRRRCPICRKRGHAW